MEQIHAVTQWLNLWIKYVSASCHWQTPAVRYCRGRWKHWKVVPSATGPTCAWTFLIWRKPSIFTFLWNSWKRLVLHLFNLSLLLCNVLRWTSWAAADFHLIWKMLSLVPGCFSEASGWDLIHNSAATPGLGFTCSQYLSIFCLHWVFTEKVNIQISAKAESETFKLETWTDEMKDFLSPTMIHIQRRYWIWLIHKLSIAVWFRTTLLSQLDESFIHLWN